MERKTMTNQNQEPKMTLAEFMALEFTYSDIRGDKEDCNQFIVDGSCDAISTCGTFFTCFDWHAVEVDYSDRYEIELGHSSQGCEYSEEPGVILVDEHGDFLDEYGDDDGISDLYAAIDKKLNNDDTWKSMVRDTVLTPIIEEMEEREALEELEELEEMEWLEEL